MCGFPNRYPSLIQSFKPIVGGRFITHLPPEPFLRIQGWLIRRQIFQTQALMRLKKNLDLLAPVPSSSVNIKPDRIAFQGAIKMSQAIQKAFSVTFWRFNQATFPQKRRNPAKNIEPHTMVAGSRDTHPSSLLCPYSAKAGMQSKSSFIFKYNCLMWLKRLKFFLKLSGISLPLLNVPGYMNIRHVSGNTPVDEANTEPGELLSLRQNAVLGEAQAWDRPIEPDLSQHLKDSSPDPSPASGEYGGLTAKGVRFGVWPLMPLSPVRLLCASRDSSSDASNPIPRLSIPDADPPISAIGRLSLNPSLPPGPPKHRLSDALGLHRDASKIKWDFSYIKTTIVTLLCQNT